MSETQGANADSARVPTREWADLTPNKAGQAARARALEAKQRAPARSYVGHVLDVHNSERAWRVGADGEESVGALLDDLPDGWCVLHAVPVGERGSDIDHLLIGPGGVFTVNTKHHPQGRVWVMEHSFTVNGQRTEYLRNSRFEAQPASRLLTAACRIDVTVTPIIAVIAFAMFVNMPPVGVEVMARDHLVHWLTRQPVSLGPETVDRIFARARRDTTWRPPGRGAR